MSDSTGAAKDDYPIDVGSMLFTMVDPNHGHEVEYNRWYERDHFYAGCMIGPGILSGARWVATRDLKDLRFPAASPFADPIDSGSYLAIYWINDGQHEEWGAWASEQVWWLYDNDRGFDQRTHAQTGLYGFAGASYAPDHQVPVSLALDHRYDGLLVVVIEPSDDDRGALVTALTDGPLQALFATGSASLASSWTINRPAARNSDDQDEASPMPLGATGGSDHRVVQLLFSECAPDAAWDDLREYAAAIEREGLGRITFAAPFKPTDVGTDRYTDELW